MRHGGRYRDETRGRRRSIAAPPVLLSVNDADAPSDLG
jgi:hypothetical protein